MCSRNMAKLLNLNVLLVNQSALKALTSNVFANLISKSYKFSMTNTSYFLKGGVFVKQR